MESKDNLKQIMLLNNHSKNLNESERLCLADSHQISSSVSLLRHQHASWKKQFVRSNAQEVLDENKAGKNRGAPCTKLQKSRSKDLSC